MADHIPKQRMIPLLQIKPTLQKRDQITCPFRGSLAVAMSGGVGVRCILGKHFYTQFGQAHQAKSKWKIGAQAVVSDLKCKTGKLAQRWKIDGLRGNPLAPQKGRIHLPLRKKGWVMHSGRNHGVNVTW